MPDEILHFRPGERIKRGGTVIVGEGEIAYEAGETRPTKLKAYWCPDQCKIQPEHGRIGTPVFWVYNPVGEIAAKLTPCCQCGRSLVEKPKRARGQQEE